MSRFQSACRSTSAGAYFIVQTLEHTPARIHWSKKGAMVRKTLHETLCRFTRSSVCLPCPVICAYYPRAGRYSKFNSQKREKTMRPRQHAPSPSSDRFFCCPRQRSAPSGITPFCRITTGVNSPPTKNYGFKCRPHQRETTPLVLILS